MSRKAMVKIDRARLDRWLKVSGVTQRTLCQDILQMEPESLNRCLRQGKISEENLQLIAEALNADPAWLSGEASGMFPITYKMKTLELTMDHSAQVMEMLFTVLGCGGISYSDLSAKDQREAQNLIGWTLQEYLTEKGYYTGARPKDLQAFSAGMDRIRNKSLPGMSNYEGGPIWTDEKKE